MAYVEEWVSRRCMSRLMMGARTRSQWWHRAARSSYSAARNTRKPGGGKVLPTSQSDPVDC